MINEMRNIVGSVPLPVEALLNRHSRPTPVPAAPMGFRVDHVHPVESFASEHARRWEAVERNSEQGRYAPRLETPNSVYRAELLAESRARAELFAARTTPTPRTDRELSFGEASPSRLWGFFKLMLMIACFVAMHLLAIAFVQHPTISGLIECRNFAPEWACNSLGYANSTVETALSHELPAVNTFTVEPGAPDMSQVPHDLRHGDGGGNAWALLMPMLLCLTLIAHSAYATTKFARGRLPHAPSWPRFPLQASWRNLGLGRPRDPLRATPTTRTTPSRTLRRRPPRYGDGTSSTSSSRFFATLGEAPLWLSICLLALEIGAYVVPGLAALSIQTLVINVLRHVLTNLRDVCYSYEATPVRVILRVSVNAVTAILYLAASLLVNTVVSERPFVSAGDLWKCPYEHCMLAPPRQSYLGAVAATVYVAARSLLSRSGMDLSRWGGGSGGQDVVENSNGDRPTEPRLLLVDLGAESTPRDRPNAHSGRTSQAARRRGEAARHQSRAGL